MTVRRHALVAALALATTTPLAAASQTARAEAPKAALPEGTRLADKIVAIVNAEPVTLFELRRAAAPQLAKAMHDARGDQNRLERALRKVVKDTLDALVDDILIAAQAKQMDLTVAPEKIDANLQKIQEQNGWTDEEFAEELGKLGFSSVADYRRHTEREMLKSQVVGIKVAGRVKVDEAQVDQALKEQVSASGTIEERHAAHILIRLDELASDEVVDAAKQKLADARAKVLAGQATFAELARQLSDDTNKGSGGDLGWFSRGDFDPSFEDVAYKLKKGEVSEPFRTPFGVHIVLVDDIRQKSLTNAAELETLKKQIRFQLREKELERLYTQWVRSLRTDAFVQIKDLGLGLPGEGDTTAPEPSEEAPPTELAPPDDEPSLD